MLFDIWYVGKDAVGVYVHLHWRTRRQTYTFAAGTAAMIVLFKLFAAASAFSAKQEVIVSYHPRSGHSMVGKHGRA